MKKIVVCILTVVILIFSINIFAKDKTNNEALVNKLITAKTLKFIPQKSCTADWKKGNPKLLVDNDVTDKEFPQLIFDAIDLEKGTARIIGNQGATDIMAILTYTGITFIEQTGSGNMNYTTVFFSCVEGTEDYITVHSRHLDLMAGTPFPSQLYGICKIWE